MIKINCLILLMIIFLLTGCASTIGFPNKPGVFIREIILQNNTKMRYTISLPESFSGDKKIPLILALHYGGEVKPYYGKEYLNILVKPAMKELKAIIAAPDCPGDNWANPEADTIIMEFLEMITTEYNIDKNKIIITGYSMGGIGTWYLASRHPEVFSAVIPVSAIPDLKDTQVVKDLPFFIIHSRNDKLFSIDSLKKFIQMYRSKGGSIQFLEVQGVSHYDTYHFIHPLKQAIPWIQEIWNESQ
ncbi:MAG: alpha/beta hydrolase-fold protein [bacterium]